MTLAVVDITNSTIGSMNRAISFNGPGLGGGIFLDATGILNLTNSTVASDYADWAGGGIYVSSTATLTASSATVAFNWVGAVNGSGGGVYVQSVQVNNIIVQGTLTTVNSAYVQNAAANGPDVSGNVSSQGFNLIDQWAGSVGFIPGADINAFGATNFQPLAMNGGPTQTCSDDFWAIDEGSNAAATVAGLVNDQRGPGFARIQGDAVDIGAYESAPVGIGNNPAA